MAFFRLFLIFVFCATLSMPSWGVEGCEDDTVFDDDRVVSIVDELGDDVCSDVAAFGYGYVVAGNASITLSQMFGDACKKGYTRHFDDLYSQHKNMKYKKKDAASVCDLCKEKFIVACKNLRLKNAEQEYQKANQEYQKALKKQSNTNYKPCKDQGVGAACSEEKGSGTCRMMDGILTCVMSECNNDNGYYKEHYTVQTNGKCRVSSQKPVTGTDQDGDNMTICGSKGFCRTPEVSAKSNKCSFGVNLVTLNTGEIVIAGCKTQKASNSQTTKENKSKTTPTPTVMNNGCILEFKADGERKTKLENVTSAIDLKRSAPYNGGQYVNGINEILDYDDSTSPSLANDLIKINGVSVPNDYATSVANAHGVYFDCDKKYGGNYLAFGCKSDYAGGTHVGNLDDTDLVLYDKCVKSGNSETEEKETKTLGPTVTNSGCTLEFKADGKRLTELRGVNSAVFGTGKEDDGSWSWGEDDYFDSSEEHMDISRDKKPSLRNLIKVNGQSVEIDNVIKNMNYPDSPAMIYFDCSKKYKGNYFALWCPDGYWGGQIIGHLYENADEYGDYPLYDKCILSDRCLDTDKAKFPHADEFKFEDGKCIPVHCEEGYDLDKDKNECKEKDEPRTECTDADKANFPHADEFKFEDGKCIPVHCEEDYDLDKDKNECKEKDKPRTECTDAEKANFPHADKFEFKDGQCKPTHCEKGYKLKDGECVDDGIKEAEDKYKKAKDTENSFENRMLGGTTMAATGIGGMQLAQGLAEQAADKNVAADMAAYMATFQCKIGDTGDKISGGDMGITTPGANQLINLYQSYVDLAASLKQRKADLGIRAGIESDVVLDKSATGLYDDKGNGVQNGTYASLYRAAMGNQTDIDKLNAQSDATTQRAQIGGTVAGAGAIGGAIGNALINGGDDKSGVGNFDISSLKLDTNTMNALKTKFGDKLRNMDVNQIMQAVQSFEK